MPKENTATPDLLAAIRKVKREALAAALTNASSMVAACRSSVDNLHKVMQPFHADPSFSDADIQAIKVAQDDASNKLNTAVEEETRFRNRIAAIDALDAPVDADNVAS